MVLRDWGVIVVSCALASCARPSGQALVHVRSDIPEVDRFRIEVIGPYQRDRATLARGAPNESRVFGVAPARSPKDVQIQVRIEALGPFGTTFAQAERLLEGFESGLLHHYVFLAKDCSACPSGLVCGPCGCEPSIISADDRAPSSWSSCAKDAGTITIDAGPPADNDEPELFSFDEDAGILDVLDPVIDEDGPDAGVADVPQGRPDLGLSAGRTDATIRLLDHGIVDAAAHGRLDFGGLDFGFRPDLGDPADGSVNNGRK